MSYVGTCLVTCLVTCAWASLVLAQAVPGIAELPEVRSGEYRYVGARQYAPTVGGEVREIDFYLPADTAAAPLLVWFHGGGLTGGAPHLPDGLRKQGVAVAVVRYRLAPDVSVREKIQDAAAAVAYVLQQAKPLGYARGGVILTGHSAGGYLASMVALDTSYLGALERHPRELLAVVPLSGHTITHFTERAARGMPETQAVVDSLAPLYHVRRQALPFLLITGDAELELLGRYEENAYFARMMRLAGNEQVHHYELEGYGHDMVAPALPLVVRFARRLGSGGE